MAGKFNEEIGILERIKFKVPTPRAMIKQYLLVI